MVVENTGYGVRPGTPDTRQRTTTGGIELKPNLVYSNIAADHGNQTEQNGDHPHGQSTLHVAILAMCTCTGSRNCYRKD